MKNKKTILILFLLICICLIGCSSPIKTSETLSSINTSENTMTMSESNSTTTSAQKTEDIIIENSETFEIETENETEPIIDETVKLMAVGDNLIHSNVITAGIQSDGTYNYDMFFENIKEDLSTSDIKVINQETVLINDSNEYSGYPTFGSPLAIGEAIYNAGFNVVTQATNHAYDKRQTGLSDSYNFWNQYEDVTLLGIHDSQEDYDEIKIITINNITFAMLNFTYGLNGFVLPNDKQYLVDTLYDKEKVISDLKKADELADFVIVFPHWGTEYVYAPTSYQTEWAQIFADNGADVIIGTHPHVVEPVKIITSADGKEVPCFYSLGNFISAQSEVPRMLGGMAKVTFRKTNDGVFIEDYSLEGLVTHLDKNGTITAYKLNEYSEELAQNHKMRAKKGSSFSYDALDNLFNDITTNY